MINVLLTRNICQTSDWNNGIKEVIVELVLLIDNKHIGYFTGIWDSMSRVIEYRDTKKSILDYHLALNDDDNQLDFDTSYLLDERNNLENLSEYYKDGKLEDLTKLKNKIKKEVDRLIISL